MAARLRNALKVTNVCFESFLKPPTFSLISLLDKNVNSLSNYPVHMTGNHTLMDGKFSRTTIEVLTPCAQTLGASSTI